MKRDFAPVALVALSPQMLGGQIHVNESYKVLPQMAG